MTCGVALGVPQRTHCGVVLVLLGPCVCLCIVARGLCVCVGMLCDLRCYRIY